MEGLSCSFTSAMLDSISCSLKFDLRDDNFCGKHIGYYYTQDDLQLTFLRPSKKKRL